MLAALRQKTPASPVQGRSLIAVLIGSLVLGIAAAEGVFEASLFVVVAAMISVTALTRLLGEANRAAWKLNDASSPLPWLVVSTWALLAPAWRLGTLDMAEATAHQAVSGPAVLTGGIVGAVVVVLGLAGGWLATVFWVESLPKLPGAIGAFVRWACCVMVPLALVSLSAGPGLGVIALGPLKTEWVGALISFLLAIATVAGVSYTRRAPKRFPSGVALACSLLITSMALLVATLAA